MAEPFRIALTMAGAISAGAYTAGVLDFLLEALDQWERAKSGALPPDERGAAPRHRVLLSAVTAASAGSVCAGVLAASLGRSNIPMSGARAPAVGANKLYDSWVRAARIEGLLETDDLGPGSVARSALNSDYLTRMAQDSLEVRTPYARPPYVAEPLEIILTTGNLRGVAYGISFSGEETDGHDMVLHGDWQHFYLSTRPDDRLDALEVTRLDPNRTDDAWRIQLRDAALASSAFPFGLAARLVHKPARYYSRRRWPVPGGRTGAPVPRPDSFSYATWFAETPIPPLSPDASATGSYDYLAVDGGVYNNEPFELAHRILAGDEYSNPRGGAEADRAVILIDPFPDPIDRTADYRPSPDLASVAKALLAASTQQARFKPEELFLAIQPEVFSRFLIAPIGADVPAGQRARPPMASAALKGFGGFLSESFRHHDFQLGRRNCQRFLQRHFALFPENPVFDAPAGRADGFNFDGPDASGETRAYRPIIPLLGSAREEVPAPPDAVMTAAELAALEEPIGRRLDAFVGRALANHLKSWPWRAIGWGAWQLVRRPARRRAMSMITEDLRVRGLLASP